MAHNPSAQPIDNVDPHHELGHHGHVIIRASTLVAVLAALLTFTVMTVAASRIEVWAAETFDVQIPNIVNVLVALSIATVKSILVAMYFMQLKYDNPLNTIVFLFCLFAFALFLFLSMTDLATRDAIEPIKAGEIQAGGTGIDTTVKDNDGNVVRGVATGTDGIVAFARKRRIERIGELMAAGQIKSDLSPEQRYWQEYAIFHHVHHREETLSTANRVVRPAPGPTPGLYEPDHASPAAGHGGGH